MQARSVTPHWPLLALYVVLTVVALSPLLAAKVPPLVDYPNHLSRLHILSEWANDPLLQRNYVVDWAPAPNLAMEFLILPLSRVMSVFDAGRIYIAACIVLFVVGTLLLRRVVYGRVGLMPVVVFPFIFHHALYFGFLSFVFAGGLFLIALAAWIALRDRGTVLRLCVFVPVCLVLYFSHVFALAMYGVAVFGYEIWRLRERSPITLSSLVGAGTIFAAQFALPMALFIVWQQSGGGSEGTESLNTYGTMRQRVVSLAAPVLFDGSVNNIRFVIAGALGMVAIYVVSVLRRRQGKPFVEFTPTLHGPLIALCIAAILVPREMNGVWGVDFRIPPFIICLIVASLRVDLSDSRWIRPAVAFGVIGLFMFRTTTIALDWSERDRDFNEFLAASAKIERGARIFSIENLQDVPRHMFPFIYRQYWHMPAMASIERSTFFPLLFTGHTMVRASDRTAPIDTQVGLPVARAMLARSATPGQSPWRQGQVIKQYFRAYWIDWPRHFDYLVAIRFGNERNPCPRHLSRVVRGSYFDIYRVLRPADDAPIASGRSAVGGTPALACGGATEAVQPTKGNDG